MFDDYWKIVTVRDASYDVGHETAIEVMTALRNGIVEFVEFTDLHGDSCFVRADSITDVYTTTTAGRASMLAQGKFLEQESGYAG